MNIRLKSNLDETSSSMGKAQTLRYIMAMSFCTWRVGGWWSRTPPVYTPVSGRWWAAAPRPAPPACASPAVDKATRAGTTVSATSTNSIYKHEFTINLRYFQIVGNARRNPIQFANIYSSSTQRRLGLRFPSPALIMGDHSLCKSDIFGLWPQCNIYSPHILIKRYSRQTQPLIQE